jgi:hypothetical protein
VSLSRYYAVLVFFRIPLLPGTGFSSSSRNYFIVTVVWQHVFPLPLPNQTLNYPVASKLVDITLSVLDWFSEYRIILLHVPVLFLAKMGICTPEEACNNNLHYVIVFYFTCTVFRRSYCALKS